MLKRLLPPAKSVQKVETNRFARADLERRLLMIDDDMDMNALPKTNYIKTIVTAEAKLDLERKGVCTSSSVTHLYHSRSLTRTSPLTALKKMCAELCGVYGAFSRSAIGHHQTQQQQCHRLHGVEGYFRKADYFISSKEFYFTSSGVTTAYRRSFQRRTATERPPLNLEATNNIALAAGCGAL